VCLFFLKVYASKARIDIVDVEGDGIKRSTDPVEHHSVLLVGWIFDGGEVPNYRRSPRGIGSAVHLTRHHGLVRRRD
jgi:hypothetical protein